MSLDLRKDHAPPPHFEVECSRAQLAVQPESLMGAHVDFGTNALPLMLTPLQPPFSLRAALFCGMMSDHSESSHIDTSDGGQHAFAFHSNTRNYIRRRDVPPTPPANSSHINYSTEWKCDQGIIWPKIVNYALQCSKGHNLACLTSTPSQVRGLCRVCGLKPTLYHLSNSQPIYDCRSCDYMVCDTCVKAVAPHSHQPPPPPPPSFLHRGVRLDVLREFKQNWGRIYGRWTTEQVLTHFLLCAACILKCNIRFVNSLSNPSLRDRGEVFVMN
jgi:hypothetical protein